MNLDDRFRRCPGCNKLTPNIGICVSCNQWLVGDTPKNENDMDLEFFTRPLSDKCDWSSGDVIIAKEKNRFSLFVKRNEEKNRIGSIYSSYEYKMGYFNPWYHQKVFDLYVQSMGFSLGQREQGQFVDYCYATYRDYECIIITEWILPCDETFGLWKQRIHISLYPTDETFTPDKDSYDSFVEIIEKYLVSGYNPGDDILNDLKVKNEPARIIAHTASYDMDGHGRHTLDFSEMHIHNKKGQTIDIMTGTSEAYSTYLHQTEQFINCFSTNVEVTQGKHLWRHEL